MPVVLYGSGSIANRSSPGEEYVGFTSTGLTQIDSDAAANAPSSPVTLGTASGALWKGVIVVLAGGNGGATGQNMAFALSFDGGSTYLDWIYVKPSPSMSTLLYLPLNIQTTATASDVKVKLQCSSTTSDFIKIGLIGLLNNDNNARPLWDNMVSETISLSGETAPNASGSALTVGTGSGTYVAIDTSASQAFECLIPVFGTASATAQEEVRVDFTVENNGGTAGTGTALATRYLARNTANPTTAFQYGAPIYEPISSTQQISAAANSATGGGTIRVGYLGFY